VPDERVFAHTGAFPVVGRASVVNAYDTSAPQVSYLSAPDAGAGSSYGRTMDRSTALEQLAAVYATTLRLNDEGATHNRIARTLSPPSTKPHAALDAWPQPSVRGVLVRSPGDVRVRRVHGDGSPGQH
jgi:hypothetical protein